MWLGKVKHTYPLDKKYSNTAIHQDINLKHRFMNLLRYEFIDGPDDSINGMIRKLITDLRYNRSMEIMQELNEESENEINIEEDLRRATVATIDSVTGEQIDFNDLSYATGKAEHYHWLRFSGYTDQRPLDSNIIIARETFRAICSKYNYIFIDLS